MEDIHWDRPLILDGEQIFLSRPLSLPAESERSVCWPRTRTRTLPRSMGDQGRWRQFLSDVKPLHFRLEGPPGVGKNRLVYELCRKLEVPFFSVVGHEELTPEDLSVVVIPDSSSPSRFRLRATPLATAILVGGVFFFDEINRAPPRALSPLSSILDGRQLVYSAILGRSLEPIDTHAKSSFRFCCALNPEGVGVALSGLPEYVEERTLPSIAIEHLSPDQLREIIEQRQGPVGKHFVSSFLSDANRHRISDMSLRQVLSMIALAENLALRGKSPRDALDEASSLIR